MREAPGESLKDGRWGGRLACDGGMRRPGLSVAFTVVVVVILAGVMCGFEGEIFKACGRFRLSVVLL